MVMNITGFNDGDTEAAITVPAPVLNTITNYDIPVQFVAFKNDSLFRVIIVSGRVGERVYERCHSSTEC